MTAKTPSRRVIDDPIGVLTRLTDCLDEACHALDLAHGLARGDACLDDDEPLTWIAFGLVATLATVSDDVARYRSAAATTRSAPRRAS